MKSGWYYLWRDWGREYYMPLLVLILALTICIVFFFGKSRLKNMWMLQLHAFASFIQTTTAFFSVYLLKPPIIRYGNYSASVFAILEGACFYYFMRPEINNNKLRLLTDRIFKIFIAWMTTYMVLNINNSAHLRFLMLGGCLFILVVCCAYYYTLLKKANEVNLLNIPHFWITTAMLFLIFALTPISVIESPNNKIWHVLNALIFFFYSLLFATYLVVYIWTSRPKATGPETLKPLPHA